MFKHLLLIKTWSKTWSIGPFTRTFLGSWILEHSRRACSKSNHWCWLDLIILLNVTVFLKTLFIWSFDFHLIQIVDWLISSSRQRFLLGTPLFKRSIIFTFSHIKTTESFIRYFPHKRNVLRTEPKTVTRVSMVLRPELRDTDRGWKTVCHNIIRYLYNIRHCYRLDSYRTRGNTIYYL